MKSQTRRKAPQAHAGRAKALHVRGRHRRGTAGPVAPGCWPVVRRTAALAIVVLLAGSVFPVMTAVVAIGLVAAGCVAATVKVVRVARKDGWLGEL